MNKIEWKQEFSVGDEVMDEQHRQIIHIINDSIDLANEGEVSDAQVYDILVRMMKYAWNHFDSEEVLLKKMGVADLKEHIEQHDSFTDKILDLSLINQHEKNIGQINELLSEWWMNHILIEYMKHKSV